MSPDSISDAEEFHVPRLNAQMGMTLDNRDPDVLFAEPHPSLRSHLPKSSLRSPSLSFSHVSTPVSYKKRTFIENSP
jgi:hypothetical protein